MGWLRQLVQHSTFRSLDSLAKSCVSHRRWPADVTVQPRSLGALLGKLDRQEELEWLANRPEIQAILAELLGASFTEVQRALPALPSRHPHRWIWRDAPRANSLELLREPLPPGLPDEAIGFASPARAGKGERWLWSAPEGSGQELLGRWLSTNHQAQVFRSGENLEGRNPRHSLFVPLEEYSLDTLNSLAQVFTSLPTSTNILLAVPISLSTLKESDPFWNTFKAIDAAATAEDTQRFVTWLLPRLPRDSVLAQPRCLAFVEETIRERHWTTFDDILSLCGTVDTLAFEGRGNLERLLINLVNSRLAHLAGDPLAVWLNKHARALLSGVFVQLLERGLDWHEARSVDAWSDLVPDEFRQTVDKRWLLRMLPDAEAHIRPRDVERAVKQLSPGAFQLVLALERLGFLSHLSPDKLTFAPHWLGRFLFELALADTVRLGSPALGRLLLGEHAAEITECLAKPSCLDELDLDRMLENLDAERNIASVTTLDMVFRLTGLALFRGIELEAEQLTDLWNEQVATLLPSVVPTIAPLLGYPKTQIDRQILLSDGFFCVAALAIGERTLPSASPHQLLKPWHLPTTLKLPLEPLLDSMNEFLSAAEANGELWLDEVYLLLHRLRPHAAPLLQQHSVFRMSCIAAACESKTLAWSLVCQVPSEHFAVAAFKKIVGSEPRFAEASRELASAYERAGCPEDMRFLAPFRPFAKEFWPHLSAAFAVSLLRVGRPLRLDLSPALWPELLDLWQSTFSVAQCSHMPARVANDAVRRFETLPAELIAAISTHHNGLCEIFCQELLRTQQLERLIRFLLCIPTAKLGDWVRRLALTPDQLLSVPSATQAAFMVHLQTCVRLRSVEFSEAFQLLLGLQQASLLLHSSKALRSDQ